MEGSLLLLLLAISIANFVASQHAQTNRVPFTREFLLGLQWNRQPLDDSTCLSLQQNGIYSPIDRDTFRKTCFIRKRGRKGGVRQRIKNQRRDNRLPLPSIILANAQSIRNKTDELQGNVEHLHEYRDACLLAITESWLKDSDLDSSYIIKGFGAPVRMDRDPKVTNKSCAGGVCLYINQRWCNNVTVRERICLPDIELLSVSVRPFYLPREIPQIFVTVVYIHPEAIVNNASDTIFRVIQRLQSISPDAPNLIVGDFNSCTLNKTLTGFYQYVTCPTRRNRTIDLCYGSIKGAYKSVALPPLGSSDHNVVHLLPIYKSILRREKVLKRQVKVWTEDSTLALQGCFDCTDWSVLIEAAASLDELTDAVCSYITFCVDSVIPSKDVIIYPNNKPWVSKALKALFHKRKLAFQRGDMDTVKEVRKEVRAELEKAKLRYKEKVEAELSSNNTKSAWNGMKTMTGQQVKGSKPICLDGFKSDRELADGLNSFYTRFDNHDFRSEVDKIRDLTRTGQPMEIDAWRVKSIFKHTKARKSPGPDNICGRTLNTCAEQLSGIFHFIFTLSRQLQIVPKTWKHSTIVPVPKVTNPKVPNDIRPVALTSLVMKGFEKIIKMEVLSKVENLLDPLQFAYRAGRGVEDAALTLLHFLHQHLDRPRTHARLLFIDFSSAFNTIQPHLLGYRLLNDFLLDPSLVGWIMDFLTQRSQCVRVNGTMSDKLLSSTGSPQGCCLSPVLYILYTNNCTSMYENRHILKFADDSVIVSLLTGEEQVHGPVVNDFVSWCDVSFLQLNVSKTKEVIVDLRKFPSIPVPISIKGVEIERVDSYKYLGIVIDKDLSFGPHVDTVTKKMQQRLFFLRKMNSFRVCSKMMTIFYRSFIESAFTFCMAAWYGYLSMQNRNKLQGKINLASKISRVNHAQPTDLYKKQVLRVANAILLCPDHPLRNEFELLPLGRRFRLPRRHGDRHKKSFIYAAIDWLNHPNK